MRMTPPWRKLALAIHLTVSIGWIGGALVYLALGLLAVRSQDEQTVRAAWIAMEASGWYVLVPLAVATVVTGLVMSLGTKWGLLRHYWVLISFILTCFAATILVLHMPSVSSGAEVARSASGTRLRDLGGDLFHPTIGLMVLLAALVLNVYKPPGMTRYGWRKHQATRAIPADAATGASASKQMP
jgi:SNF family Na+-dependent transporter